MRLIDELTGHPLFEERPAKDVFEPLGFEVHIEFQETPDPDEEPEDAERFEADPNAFMAAIPFDVPEGFIEIARFDTEDCEVVMLAVKPTTPLAHMLMLPAEGASPVAAIAAERLRQVEAEGWDPEHDDQYQDGELSRASVAYSRYAMNDGAHHAALRYRDAGAAPTEWPWAPKWWKPTSRRRDLVKAAALIVAEMERLDRMEGRQS